jgi:hypothetical protein
MTKSDRNNHFRVDKLNITDRQIDVRYNLLKKVIALFIVVVVVKVKCLIVNSIQSESE